MSRYDVLADHLKRLDQSSWDARFDDIEKVMGQALPQSAYRYPAWWANQAGAGHSQTRGWKGAGWRTAKLDLAARTVRFERIARSTDDEDLEAMLAQQAQELTGIDDRSSLLREAFKALIAREAGRRLASLGGTMPDYKAAPRERGSA